MIVTQCCEKSRQHHSKESSKAGVEDEIEQTDLCWQKHTPQTHATE